jgi:hypothetical protein
LGSTSIFPPKCMRKVRSETLSTDTPSSARTAARTASPRLAVAAGDRDAPHCDTALLAHEVDRAEHRIDLADRADHAGK